MPGRKTRDQIIDAADDLFYRRGYAHTSFADIAGAVDISRGNFYYHFKAKDQILDAVIAQRVVDTEQMLADWAAESDDPADRICSFIHILIRNQGDIERFGCPVGTLNTEMRKLDHPAGEQAQRLFALFRDWLTVEFDRLGLGSSAEHLALHLLARSQGVATLSNTFQDREFVDREVTSMRDWLDDQIRSVPSPQS